MTETLKPPPKNLGVTHWSSRLLADRLTISNTSIVRAWRAYRVKPWKAESFRLSTDPELVGKVTDICGLYLGTNEDIPANAVVLSSAPTSRAGTKRAHPFVWTKTADEILKKANRSTTSDPRH